MWKTTESQLSYKKPTSDRSKIKKKNFKADCKSIKLQAKVWFKHDTQFSVLIMLLQKICKNQFYFFPKKPNNPEALITLLSVSSSSIHLAPVPWLYHFSFYH